MDGESIAPQTENKNFNTGLGFTSTKLPVVAEAMIASASVLSATVLFFVEKQDVYCRSCAIQSFVWFFVCFIAAFPFYLTCIAYGGFAELLMLVYWILYLIFKVVLIVMAGVKAKSEEFIAIPPFTHLITKYASLSTN